MDGKTVARMRLLERTAAELQGQNTYLSDQVLRMSEVVDRAAKASHVDRLLIGALLRWFDADARAEIPIADVDALRVLLAHPPGLSVITTKDVERGLWVVELTENEPVAEESPAPPPSLIVIP
jgi:hypothetical protein